MKLIFLFLAWAAVAAEKNSLREMLVSGCTIYDPTGAVVRKFPGGICAFLPDGKIVLSNRRELIVYSPSMKELSRDQIHVHHEMSYEPAIKGVLMTSSEFLPDQGRIDNLLIYGLNGKLRSKFRLKPAHSLKKEAIGWDQEYLEGHAIEYSHVNSFHLIPKNRSPLKELTAGNFIANDIFGAIHILDPGLKKILRTFSYKDLGLKLAHDVQVLENGNFLLYSNRNGPPAAQYTLLLEVNPVSGKEEWRYARSPKEAFSSPVSGSVQKLPNGNYLFSDVTSTDDVFEITPAGKEVRALKNVPNMLRLNQIKQVDLTDFLRNSKSF